MKVSKTISSQKRNVELWLDRKAARLFLTFLVDGSLSEAINWSELFVDPVELADWCVAQEIGPLVYYRFQEIWPELGMRLQKDAFAASAENSLHFDRLRRINHVFKEAGIPFVLLKGVALAHVFYPNPALRTMSDIDIWVQSSHMARAYKMMKGLGFRALGHPERPPKLQLLYQGEIQFYDEHQGLVELHWAPISGWQVKNTTAIDFDAIWARREVLSDCMGEAHILAEEDMIIQLALHTAINHRFRLTAIRSFIDIALTAKGTAVSWPVVAERASSWRVRTAVWCTLNLVKALIDVPGIEAALDTLRPSRLRRFLIKQFVSAESILASDDLLGDPMQNNLMGYFFLLLLIDRPIDAIKLIGRALWPTQTWLSARYGPGAGRWRHIGYLLRRGRI